MNLSMNVTKSFSEIVQSFKIDFKIVERRYSFSVKSKKQCYIVRQNNPDAISSGCARG